MSSIMLAATRSMVSVPSPSPKAPTSSTCSGCCGPSARASSLRMISCPPHPDTKNSGREPLPGWSVTTQLWRVCCAGVLAQQGGELADRRRLEERCGAQLPAHAPVDLGEHAHGEHRVAAEIEEVGVERNAGAPERGLPDGAQRALDRVAVVVAVSGVRALFAGRGCRQCGAIELAVGCERQRVEFDECGRNHERGQALGERGAHPGGIEALDVGAPDEVGDEPAIARSVRRARGPPAAPRRAARRWPRAPRRARCGSRAA